MHKNLLVEMIKKRKAKQSLLMVILVTLLVGVCYSPKPSFRRRKRSDEAFLEKMQLRMESRQQHIEKICEERDLEDSVDSVRQGVVYSEKYNVVFCQIPKTGMTNWMRVFAKLEGILKPGYENELSKQEIKRVLKTYGEAASAKLKDPNVLKLLVVREPLERLLSAYRDKLGENPMPFYRKMSEKMHRDYSKETITGDSKAESKYANFNEFLMYLIDSKNMIHKHNDYHWKMYRDLCQPCAVKYDVIIHQETVEEDSRYFLDNINAPEDVILDDAYNSPTDNEMMRRYYSTVIPRESLWKLYELLKDDYLLFNYSKPFVLS